MLTYVSGLFNCCLGSFVRGIALVTLSCVRIVELVVGCLTTWEWYC